MTTRESVHLEPVRIKRSKFKIALILAGLLLSMALTASFALGYIEGQTWRTGPLMSRLGLVVLGLVTLAAIRTIVVVGRSPLTLSVDGIHDPRVSDKVISWDDVRSIEYRKRYPHPFVSIALVVLQVDLAGGYLIKRPWLEKALDAIFKKKASKEVVISSTILKIRSDQLFVLIKQFWEAFSVNSESSLRSASAT